MVDFENYSNRCWFSANLSLNPAKIALVGIDLAMEDVRALASFLGCEINSLPINYLGFLLAGNHHRSHFWDFLVDKLKDKLDRRRSLHLSKGGRFIQLVLNSLPNYHFSLLWAPKNVINSMEKIIRDIIWTSGAHKPSHNLVEWEWTTLPTSLGVWVLELLATVIPPC